jgi:hypothetical protein
LYFAVVDVDPAGVTDAVGCGGDGFDAEEERLLMGSAGR